MTMSDLRVRLSLVLHVLAEKIHPVPVKPVEGQRLQFLPVGRNMGHPVYDVASKLGGMGMGRIEWSNQWGRPRFKAHPEAIFDQQCIAEIYACMRDMK